MGSVTLEPFYGAAARSMSQSWHNFIFGAADPWGTVSVDKLPGALWVQSLSLRLFGFHLWAIVLPQVVEGVLTVLVLYRAVRRVAGAGAGLIAATVMAISPVTVLLNRGNISDSLLILMLALAADATTRAIIDNRPRSLLMAGVWVGLAFQAKMTQAWLILPALYLAYVIAAPATGFLRRSGHIVLSGLIVLVVSLSYMTAVSAVPAHDRPFVDGSCDNSIYSQVFLYNGLARLNVGLDESGCSKPSGFLQHNAKLGESTGLGTFGIGKGPGRLLTGPFGRDDAWLLIPTVVSALGLFVSRRRRPRTDPIRAATILWTSWLVLTFAFFSAGKYLNSYYLAALIPAFAALCGMGAALAWQHRQSIVTRSVVAATVAASTAYALVLLPDDVGIRIPIFASTLVVAALAVAILAASLGRRHASVWTVTVGLGLSAIALLISSAWATTTVLVTGEGPFDTPYQPASVTFLSQTVPTHDRSDWPELNRLADSFPRHQAVEVWETSGIAGYYILATGREFLPVGGFTGTVPVPTVAQFVRYVKEHRVEHATVAVQPLSGNPVMLWITHHCVKLTDSQASFVDNDTTFQRYLCSPADAIGSS